MDGRIDVRRYAGLAATAGLVVIGSVWAWMQMNGIHISIPGITENTYNPPATDSGVSEMGAAPVDQVYPPVGESMTDTEYDQRVDRWGGNCPSPFSPNGFHCPTKIFKYVKVIYSQTYFDASGGHDGYNVQGDYYCAWCWQRMQG